jgi:hypothetical protein
MSVTRRPVLRSYQVRLSSSVAVPRHNEVVGEILWLGFTAFFAPKSHKSSFVAAHDDPGIRSTDEGAAIEMTVYFLAKLHCNLRFANCVSCRGGMIHLGS